MDQPTRLNLRCPDCGSDLVVDAATGEVLFHQQARKPLAGGQDFDRLLSGLDDEKARAAEVFDREVAAMKDRDRLLAEKFDEAMRRADLDDDSPPVRPFDLD